MLNTVRFRIPHAVASALSLDTIKRRARQSGVTDVRFDYDGKSSSSRGDRIVCSTAMAIFFVESVGTLTAKAKAQRDRTMIADCAAAVAAAFKAIDDGDQAPMYAIQPPTPAAGADF